MSESVFYRDRRNPDTLRGPVPVNELKELAAHGQIQPSFEYSVDRENWRSVREIEPPLFVFGQDAEGDPQHSGNRSAGRTANAADPGSRTASEAPGDRASNCRDGTMESPPPPASGPAAVAFAGFTHPLIVRSGRSMRTGLLRFFRLLKETFVFYWQQRDQLYRFVRDYIRWLVLPRDQREIRLSADDALSSILFDETRWEVELPDCCVVCGASTSRDWEQNSETAVDLMMPAFALLGGGVVGIVLSLVFWTLSILPLCLLAGMLLGYAQRRTIDVNLRLKRCDRHAGNTRIPRSLAFGDHLIVRVGHRSVRLQFYSEVEGRSPAASPPPHSASGDADVQSPVPPIRRTSIPLAGSAADETADASRQQDSTHTNPGSNRSDGTASPEDAAEAEPEIVDLDEWVDFDIDDRNRSGPPEVS